MIGCLVPMLLQHCITMPRTKNSQKQKCPICLSLPRVPASIDSCSHLFCRDCIATWANTQNTCPLCKKIFTKIIKQPSNCSSRPHSQNAPSQLPEGEVEEVAQRRQLSHEEAVEGQIFEIISRRCTRQGEGEFLQLYGFLSGVLEEDDSS